MAKERDENETKLKGVDLNAMLGNPVALEGDKNKQDYSTIANLKLEENELTKLINNTTPETEETLLKLTKKVSETVKFSGIDQLDSRNQNAKLPGNSNGLKEYQDKIKALFNEKLKNEAAELQGQIISELEKIQLMERNILANKLIKEDKERTSAATNKVIARLSMDDRVFASKKDGESINFLAALNQEPTKTFTNPATGEYVTLINNTLSSNSPELLGESLGAAGYRSVEISGAPKQALRAARAALAAGVSEVSFDKYTLKKIQNSQAYGSWYEYTEAMKELKAIQNWSTANMSAGSSAGSNPFHEGGPSREAQVFNQFAPDQPGREQMIKSMTQEDAAKLASELYPNTYYKGTKAYNGHDYVRSMTVRNPVEGHHFESKFVTAETNKVMPHIQSMKDDVSKVAEFISSYPNIGIRQALYNKIKDLKPHDPEKPDRNTQFQNNLRAALMGQIIDRNHRAAFNASNTRRNIFGNNVDEKTRVEIKYLLDEITKPEREAINRIYDQEYNRAAIKTKDIDEKDRENPYKDPDFVKEPESLKLAPTGEEHPKTLIDEAHLQKYRELIKEKDKLLKDIIEEENKKAKEEAAKKPKKVPFGTRSDDELSFSNVARPGK